MTRPRKSDHPKEPLPESSKRFVGVLGDLYADGMGFGPGVRFYFGEDREEYIHLPPVFFPSTQWVTENLGRWVIWEGHRVRLVDFQREA